MKKEYIKGKTTDEKFISLNRILQYMMPRLGKRTTGIITPSLMFDNIVNVGEDGVVLTKIFPIAGIISEVVVYINDLISKTDILCEIIIEREHIDRRYSFTINKDYTEHTLNIGVVKGDFLTFRVNNVDKFSGISIGTVFNISEKDISNKIFLEDKTDASEIGEAEEINGDS